MILGTAPPLKRWVKKILNPPFQRWGCPQIFIFKITFLPRSEYKKFQTMTIPHYLDLIQKRFESGISREHSYRADLSSLRKRVQRSRWACSLNVELPLNLPQRRLNLLNLTFQKRQLFVLFRQRFFQSQGSIFEFLHLTLLLLNCPNGNDRKAGIIH